jgi:hypothetical protein
MFKSLMKAATAYAPQDCMGKHGVFEVCSDE